MKATRIRMVPKERQQVIVNAAVKLAQSKPYTQVTRDEIAAAAGIVPSVVSHHFGTMTKLRRAVLRAAIAQRIVAVVADGLAARDPHAKKADEALLTQARELLVTR